MRTKRGGVFGRFRSNKIPNPVNQDEIVEQYAATAEQNSNTSYSIIVSHNSRIQCLLGKLGVNPSKKTRFKNCCILKIVLTEKFVYVELIYSGEISEKDEREEDKIFYTDTIDSYNADTKKLRWFKPVRFEMDKRKLGLQNVTLSKPYVFFLVRHGQSLHNETNTYGRKIDTPLTYAGEESALRAASSLKTYLGAKRLGPITGYFASDLYRTRQTMNFFNRPGNFGTNVHVLPCASEVGNVGQNGDCDSSGQFWNKLARENYSNCTLDLINDAKKDERSIRTNPSTWKCRANWDTYLDFYGNQIRGSNLLGKRMRCRDTNMLATAIYILDYKTMSLESFMKVDDPRPPSGPPLKNEMTKTRTGLFNWSYGGSTRRKLKRQRTRRTRA